MKHLDLYAGIGGFSLAANWMGWETVAWIEKNVYCQKVLNKNFKNVKGYGDIKQFNGVPYKGSVDIITGGFPCPEFSFAGNGRMGMELWEEMFRVCCEIEPTFILPENVPGFAYRKGGLALDQVCSDLESQNYEVLPFIISAASTGAFHKRDRVWIVAIKKDSFNTHTNRLRSYRAQVNQQRGSEFQHEQISLPGSLVSEGIRNGTDARVFGNINGISHRVDRLKSVGNSISPQAAYEIFKIIEPHNP